MISKNWVVSAVLAFSLLNIQSVCAQQAPDRCAARAAGDPLFHHPNAITGASSREDTLDYFHPVSFPLAESGTTDLPFIDAGAPLSSCQTVRGYGFALTEATLINFKKLPQPARKTVMEALFSKKLGAGFSYLVLPVSSNDFGDPSKPDHSICDCHGKIPDSKSSCFDPSSLQEPVRFLKEISKMNPDIKVMLKPWSPPPYMKKSGSQAVPSYRGGDFDIEWSESLAGCLSDAVDWISARGVKVQSVATQNEPGIKMPYPSVYMDERSQARILDDLSHDLAGKYPELQLVLRSDNFNSSTAVKHTMEYMQSGAKNLVFSAHCYGGVPSDTAMVMPKGQASFCGGEQSIEYMLGECTGHDGVSESDFPWWMKNRVMLDAWMGATGTISWNGILDDQNGPKRGGCPKCRGLVTANFSTNPPSLQWNPEFYALSQISKYVRDGAKRLVVDRINAAGVSQLIYENPDGTRVGIFWNPSQDEKKFRLYTQDCLQSEIRVGPNSALSVQW